MAVVAAMHDLRQRLEQEATDCYEWTNGPHYVYAAHVHPYEKVLYCAAGSITFVLEDEGREVQLAPGDRMVLAPGTRHSAVVGPAGVTCLEGRR